MIRYITIVHLIIAIVLLSPHTAFAIIANPAAFEVSQPNGRKVNLHIRGDEWFHWHEDLDGYTVVRDNGRYAYAQLNQDNRLVATPLTVGVDNPKALGLQKRILPPVGVRRSMRPYLITGSSESSAPQAVPPSGTVKNLVILCKFSDHTEGEDTRSPNDYDILFNQIGGDPTLAPTGSVKDLYLENSYGQMILESTVTVWVTLPNTESYYANNNDGLGNYPQNAQRMVEDALNLADPLVDFSQFDNDGDNYIDSIDIIHSGYGAETGGGGGNWIWSHRWALARFPIYSYWTSAEGVRVNDYHTEPALWGTSGTNIVRFGVIAHETGHFFGLPDLYDTDQSGEGIGSWGLMANSWGFDFSQLHPPHFSAWSKIELGWITPTVISTDGLYSIDQAEMNPQVYRIDSAYPSGEYLLIENRQPTGIETTIPQGGLCIYHIDETADDTTEGYPGQVGWPENGNHYRVAVLQADGNYNLEKNNNRGDSGDVYHAGGASEIGPGPGNYPNTDAYQNGTILITDNRVHSVSASGTSMTFVFGELAALEPPVAADVNKITQPDTPVTVTLDATDDGLPNALSYIITTLPNHGTLSDPNDPNTIINTIPYALTTGNEVIYTPRPGCDASVTFTYLANDGGFAPDGGDSNEATVSVTIIDFNLIYSSDMDINPSWSFEGDWAWGMPTGGGGAKGNPDPSSGFTGTNVVGYNLSGDYPASLSPVQWATTPAIDCSNATDVELTFYRWLNVDSFSKDEAVIEVSNDSISWVEIWRNTSKVTDSSWILQTFDISAVADNQPTVHVRWGMGPTNNNQNYSGWNIDDVELTGFVAAKPQLSGDFEPDCDVDANDLTKLISYWLATCGECEGADLIDDGVVNLADFQTLANNWLAGL